MVLKLYGLYFDLKQADCIGQVTTEAQCFTVSKTVLTSAFEKIKLLWDSKNTPQCSSPSSNTNIGSSNLEFTH